MSARRRRLSYVAIALIAACAVALVAAGVVQGDRAAALIGVGGLVSMAVAAIT